MISTIPFQNGQIKLKKEIAAGGQGRVFLADHEGNEYAFKMYHTRPDAVHWANLCRNALLKPPSPAFIWPQHALSGARTCGYLMPLLPPNVVSFEKVYTGRAPLSLSVKIHAALNLVAAFAALHLNGYAYKDLNLGGFFVHPDTGEVFVLDCDNIAVNADASTAMNILFPRFGAPEVVEGAPCTQDSDIYSLAVVLFCLFTHSDPFEGKASSALYVLDTAALKKLYGKRAVFVHHPLDVSNRPAKEHTAVQANWPTLPSAIKTLFTQCFVDGVADPSKRPSLRDWRLALADWRDQLRTCDNVSCRRVFAAVTDGTCIYCQTKNSLLRMTTSRGHTVVLVPGRQLYAHHGGGSDVLSEPIARVVPVDPNDHAKGWGLRNLSTVPWTLQSGTIVAAGKACRLVPNLKITFALSSAPVEWTLQL